MPVQLTKIKILKAILDLAILNKMTHRSAVSAPDIIDFFIKNYVIWISLGTIYLIFERLEKQGHIAKLPNRLTGLYYATTAGKCVSENLQQNLDELLLNFLLELVKKENPDI